MECLHTERRRADLRSIFVSHEILDGNKSAEFLNCLRFGDFISDSNSLGGYLEGLRESRTKELRPTLGAYKATVLVCLKSSSIIVDGRGGDRFCQISLGGFIALSL